MADIAKRQGREQVLGAKRKSGGARLSGGCLPSTIHLQRSAGQGCRFASESETDGLGCESLQYALCVCVCVGGERGDAKGGQLLMSTPES